MRRHRAILTTYSMATVAASLMIASFLGGYSHPPYRNLAVLGLVDRFSTQSLSADWGYSVAEVTRLLAMTPGDRRMQDWYMWLEERRQLVADAEANRERRWLMRTEDRAPESSVSVGGYGKTVWPEGFANSTEKHLTIARLYSERGDEDAALKSLNELWDNELKVNALIEPPEFGRYTLEGYDWSPLSVERNAYGLLILFWRDNETGHGTPVQIDNKNETYVFGDRIIQVLESRNLLSFGDIEYSPMERERPFPFPWELYPTFVSDPGDSVQIQSSNDGFGHILNFESKNGELLVTFLPLEAGADYVMVGNFKSTVPGIFMIMENVDGKNRYPAVLDIVRSSEWQNYGAIFEIAPSPYSPGMYWGAKSGESGAIEADGLGIFKITLPK